jgi:hypothetical protein
MKPHIKKLRTCAYSTDLVAANFGQREHHTNKLICDHPQMKINWEERVCGPCTIYVNRNAALVVPAAHSESKASLGTPAVSVPETSTAPHVAKAPAIPASTARLPPTTPPEPSRAGRPTKATAETKPVSERSAKAPIKPHTRKVTPASATSTQESSTTPSIKKTTTKAKTATDGASKKAASPKKPIPGKK